MKNSSTQSLASVVCCVSLFISNHSAAQNFIYPETQKQPVTETIFGKVVVDNYRWLEDVNNQQVLDWIKLQSEFTNKMLDKIPGRNALIKLDELTPSDIPYISRESGRYFYKKTMAGENVAKLYYRQGKEGKEVLLFDPHTYGSGHSKEITFNFLPSKDGKMVALSFTQSGKADISTVRVINVDTKKFNSDTLYPVNSVQAWTPDSKGFIYGALQTSDQLSTHLFQDIAVKYHQLGTDPMKDKTILSRINNPNFDLKAADLLFVDYSMDNKYLLATIWSGSQEQNKKLYASAPDLTDNQVNWKTLVKSEDEVKDAIIYKEMVYLLSRKDAPHFKVLVSPLNELDVTHAQTLVPESKQTIEWLTICRDYLFVQKTDGINSSIDQYNFSNGEVQSIKLPLSGYSWAQTFDIKTNDCILHVSSWKQPTTRYDYNPLSHQTSISVFNSTAKYPGTDDLLVEEVDVKSHDGVMVSLSLIYNKNIKKDGSNVVLMTGYGSYGISSSPWFKPMYLPLLNKGIIIAETHPRGGGEKGYAWHMGGFKATKPNTWKDFISCGEYLINNGYTSAQHLIGDGTSAGGILIGRAITERPDLFAAAINNVPVSNPLRGENRPNGILDSKEFGTVKDSTEAMGLIEMDAYLHVIPGVKYPAVIAVTGINDTRVPVWQPAKFVAALQNATTSNKPIVLQVNYDSGHWTEEKNVSFRNYANMYAFALWQAGHKDFQPTKK
ncbi:prolyl oligopeptidase family serine peptidase [Gramella sp. AN32]|uniref:prolyl oligopeptidase n=1 Tax=Christiangramia antarctica TaxID=2058158 RepID=A0ABW5X7X8_9FLAO|nr:prolyl oligopeptidase family serine peptidase [Gramella sp. AN32]MCM4155980.1 S9 family peptidase [Gramella sp. AN32]